MNSDDKIFNDICSNFTVSGIDIPVNIRKNIFYLGEDKNKNICGNKDCKLINDITFCTWKVVIYIHIIFMFISKILTGIIIPTCS